MKKLIIIFTIYIFGTFVFAQNASILAVDAQPFLRDEKNIIRYNPLNLFDNNSNTVYAINKKDFSYEKPLMQIYLGNEIQIDEIKIKPAYFDERYFKSNYRIKSGRIILLDNKDKLIQKDFKFEDKMAIQSIKFDEIYSITRVQIYVDELYSFEKWDDIVVSDFLFSLKNKDYQNIYGLFENAWISYDEENTYNLKGLLLSKKRDYPPFWGYLYKYIYDSDDRLLFRWKSGGDGPGGIYTIYEYASKNDKYPSIIHQLEEVDQIKELQDIINSYVYDENGFLVRSEDFEESNRYVYENGKIKKNNRITKNSKIEYIYYYQDEKCVLEEESNWVYIYLYDESNVLVYKIPVQTNNAEPQFFEYHFNSDNQLELVKGWTHKSW